MIQCLDVLVDPSSDALPFPDPTVTAPPIPWEIPSLLNFTPLPFNFTPDLSAPGFEVRLGGGGSKHRVSQAVTPPIELVQKFITNPGFNVGTDSQAVLFPNPPGPGHCLIAIVLAIVAFDDTTGPVDSSVDVAGVDLGHPWTNLGHVVGANIGGSGQYAVLSMWHRQAAADSSAEQTVTVTPLNSNANPVLYVGTAMAVCLLEYKNAVSVGNVNTNGENSAASGTLSTGVVTVGAKGEAIVAAFAFGDYDLTGIATPGTGYSLVSVDGTGGAPDAFTFSTAGGPADTAFVLYVQHRIGVDPPSDEPTLVDSTGPGDRYVAIACGLLNG